MHKTTLVLMIAILFFSVKGEAQKKNFSYFDSLTYNQYQSKEYKKLIKTGKEALHSGFDYYYLRMRIGIALYNRQEYRLAIPHFEKALTFSDNDIAMEYLYYSALWGGEPLKAQKLVNSMSEALKSKLGVKEKGILSTNIDMALLNKSEDIPDDFEYPANEDGYQVIPKQFFNTSLSLSHKAGSGASMSHMLTYLHKSNSKYAYSSDYSPAPNDPYFPYNDNFSTNQFQYYLSSSVTLGRGWNFMLGGHAAAIATPKYTYGSMFYRGQIQYSYEQTTDWSFDFALSASMLKNFSRMSVEGEIAIMSMNDKFIVQPAVILRLYPLGNMNLYTESLFSYSIRENSKFFQQQRLGFKVLDHLWLEGMYFSGDISGFTLNNGSMFFNGLEEVNSMAGGQMIIPTKTRFSLSLGYQNRKQTNYFVNFNDDSRSNSLKLNYSLIFLTLTWTL